MPDFKVIYTDGTEEIITGYGEVTAAGAFLRLREFSGSPSVNVPDLYISSVTVKRIEKLT